MKRQLTIFFDSDDQPTIQIGLYEPGDPWEDLAILMEALGTVAAIDRKNGHTEHNGKPVNQYLHEYLDKVLNDYDKSHTLHRLDS